MEATWALVAERGPLSVTMTQVAESAGVGRATLYKYFPDVEAILVAYHDQHVSSHLEQLLQLGDQAGDPAQRLQAVLTRYALICHRRKRHGSDELAALLHRDGRVDHAQQRLIAHFQELIAAAASNGDVRRDLAPDELASYCVHALSAAGDLASEAAVSRLVAVTMAGLSG